MKKPMIYELDLDEMIAKKDKNAGINRVANTATPAIKVVGLAFNESRKIQDKILSEVVYTEALRYADNTRQSTQGLKEITEDEYNKAKELSSVKFSNSPIDNLFTSNSILDFDDPNGDGIFMLRYAYVGPQDNKNRSFCSQMVRFSSDSVWSYEDITQDLSNPEFGRYNIFTYKGSYNCRHNWKRKFFYKDLNDKEVRSVGANPGGVARGIAIGDASATTKNNKVFSISKFSNKHKNIDHFKRRVIAPAMIPDMLIERYDEETEEEYYVKFTKESIERLQSNFQSKRLKVEFNVEHNEDELSPAYILEQWIIETEEDKAYSKYGFSKEEVPIGSWMIISQITDDEFFLSNILEKKQYGYSVEGLFDMELIELNKENKNKNNKMTNTNEFNEVVDIEGKKYTFTITDGKLEYHLFEEDSKKEEEEEMAEDKEDKTKKEEDMESEEDKKEDEDLKSDKKEEDMEEDKKEEDKEEDKLESDKKDEDMEDKDGDKNMEEDTEEEDSEKEYYTKEEIEDKLKGLLEMIAKLESDIEGKEKEEEDEELNKFSMSFSDKIKILNNLNK